jgi:hypothetical protein
MSFVKFLILMKTPNNLEIIRREVNDTKGGKDTRESRGTSDSLQGALEMAYGVSTQRCRSDTVCLLNVFEVKVTKSNVSDVLRELNDLVSALFPLANSDASYRVKVRNVILKQPWGTEVLLDKVKSSKTFALSSVKKAKRVREANDQLERRLKYPDKINEATLLRGVSELKKKRTIHDKILLVQVCIGSRFTEVLFISDITVSKLAEKPGHTYIRVYGVGKEQRESRRKNLAKLKAKRRKKSEYDNSDDESEDDSDGELEEDNAVSEFEPKEIIKPVLFSVSPKEIEDTVKDIRREIRKKVDWYDDITRADFDKLQRLANLYLQKAANRVHELFGYRHTHLMRRVYALWSWQTWGRYDMAQLGWYKAVLGHTSSNTSRAYTTLLILPIVEADQREITTVVGHVKVETDLLREQFDKMKDDVQNLHTRANPPEVEKGFAIFWVKTKWVTLQRAPNEVVADPAARVGEYADKLKEAGVRVSDYNLRQLGFGSRIIKEWRNTFIEN